MKCILNIVIENVSIYLCYVSGHAFLCCQLYTLRSVVDINSLYKAERTG